MAGAQARAGEEGENRRKTGGKPEQNWRRTGGKPEEGRKPEENRRRTGGEPEVEIAMSQGQAKARRAYRTARHASQHEKCNEQPEAVTQYHD